MVIGDDQVDANLTRAPGGVDAANAAVHRNHEPYTVGVETIERLRLEAVAVAQALGNEVTDVGAEHLERAPQNHGGRNAVDIVVAVNGDLFLPLDRREN